MGLIDTLTRNARYVYLESQKDKLTTQLKEVNKELNKIRREKNGNQ